MTDTPETPVPCSPSQILIQAANALRATLKGDGKDWNDLPAHEKSEWGLKAAPTVLAVINATKPEGWEVAFAEIAEMASAWVRAQGGNPPPRP